MSDQKRGFIAMGIILVVVATVITVILQRKKTNESELLHSEFTTSDSIAAMTPNVAPDPAVVDSIFKQQSIAFGKLKFGMTRKEYKKLPEKEKEYFQTIGDYEYTVEPFFDQDAKLYMVEIRSMSKDANYIDTDVKNSAENLHKVIAAKYSNDVYVGPYPTVLNFEAGYIKWMYSWTIGKKQIYVGAGEVQSGAEFYSVARIYDTDLYNAYNEKQASKSNEVSKSDAEKF
ncbi:MAG: hypothetical protein ACTHKV_08545 [Flavipsychrobacter sp.]